MWIDTDQFIDIENLKSIELDIIKGICLSSHTSSTYGLTLHPSNGRNDFFHFTNYVSKLSKDDVFYKIYHEVKDNAKNKKQALVMLSKLCSNVYSGGTSVYLRLYNNNGYKFKNYENSCYDTENIVYFESLMKFFKTLPFTEIGRALIFVNDHDLKTPLHRDTEVYPHRNEFLWFRTNLDKKFYIYDDTTNTKDYVSSYSAFFNEQDWHGTDESSKMCFSIRIDGVFTEEFRQSLNIDDMLDYNELSGTK